MRARKSHVYSRRPSGENRYLEDDRWRGARLVVLVRVRESGRLASVDAFRSCRSISVSVNTYTTYLHAYFPSVVFFFTAISYDIDSCAFNQCEFRSVFDACIETSIMVRSVIYYSNLSHRFVASLIFFFFFRRMRRFLKSILKLGLTLLDNIFMWNGYLQYIYITKGIVCSLHTFASIGGTLRSV